MGRSTHHTSWAASFAVAAELSRRCYDVTFTVGNAPRYDLLCTGPCKTAFKVQIKGMSKPGAIWVRSQFFSMPTEEKLFLIAVVVPQTIDDPFRYFILSYQQAQEEFKEMPTTKKNGTEISPDLTGLKGEDRLRQRLAVSRHSDGRQSGI
jgi:hypothetical protein